MARELMHPLMYWVGINLPDEAERVEIDQFNDFYSNVHAGEVVSRNPGFVRGNRLKLLRKDPRGDFGPVWLAIYELANDGAAGIYTGEISDAAKEVAPYSSGPPIWDKKKIVWRIIWRRIAEVGERPESVSSVYLVGMDPPADASDEEIGSFNEFYTNIHMPEVMKAHSYNHGMRFEIRNELLHPAPGCPRYLAMYLRDDEDSSSELGGASGVLSSGPEVWQRRNTLWRLTYSFLPAP